MPRRGFVEPDGSIRVKDNLPDNPDGSEAIRIWHCSPEQAKKLLVDTLAPGLPAGDKSTIEDRIREHEREKRAR